MTIKRRKLVIITETMDFPDFQRLVRSISEKSEYMIVEMHEEDYNE